MANKGLILLNLGSPDSPSVPDVGRYLREFLMDERVIDMPAILRNIVVKAFIVPFRAAKSAEAYHTIWTDKGSPLVVISKEFRDQVQQKVNIPVAVAMRYGNPSTLAALKELEDKNGPLDEILIAPMYPHYAMSSYETAVEYATRQILSVRKNIKLRILKPFYNEPGYITALAESFRPYIEQHNFDALLFSYHGLPIRHLKKTDTTGSHCYTSNDCCEIKSLAWDTCYKHQVKTTTKLVAEQLNLEPSKVMISFQSRLGTDKWIQPFTDKVLVELPQKGVKRLMVACPAFVADCLETLEEISIRGKETFLESGGVEFVNAPCLNTLPLWVDTFANWCDQYETDYSHLWS